jgi:lipoate-protein ligase A
MTGKRNSNFLGGNFLSCDQQRSNECETGSSARYYIETESTDAAFHFSVEEYCMRRFTGNETVWMIWQADKCAMLGRFQIADAEIDLSEAERKGVRVVRRSSGGGAIFTDMGTLLYSSIRPFAEGDDAKEILRDVAKPIVNVLRKMGVQASIEGRNDILAGGGKISGMAQHAKGGRLCSHGSLLYDADLETLTSVLRTDEGKIRSKALPSMRSRVTNLAEHMSEPCPINEFRDRLRQSLFEELGLTPYDLSADDIEQIEKIRLEKYANPEWTLGKTPRFTFSNQSRFPGGKIEVFLEIEKGVVKNCAITGDFLGWESVRPIEARIEGLFYKRDVVKESLEGMDIKPYMASIALDELLSCLFG